MARKKKEEIIEEVETKSVEVEKPMDFGTGWTGKNNKIQYEMYEVKKNE